MGFMLERWDYIPYIEEYFIDIYVISL